MHSSLPLSYSSGLRRGKWEYGKSIKIKPSLVRTKRNLFSSKKQCWIRLRKGYLLQPRKKVSLLTSYFFIEVIENKESNDCSYKRIVQLHSLFLSFMKGQVAKFLASSSNLLPLYDTMQKLKGTVVFPNTFKELLDFAYKMWIASSWIMLLTKHIAKWYSYFERKRALSKERRVISSKY